MLLKNVTQCNKEVYVSIEQRYVLYNYICLKTNLYYYYKIIPISTYIYNFVSYFIYLSVVTIGIILLNMWKNTTYILETYYDTFIGTPKLGLAFKTYFSWLKDVRNPKIVLILSIRCI